MNDSCRYSIDQAVWLGGESVYVSGDGGATFAERDTGMLYTVYDLDFIDATHGFMTGSYGETLFTTDGGASWTLAENTAWGAHMRGLSFISPEKGWLAGEQGLILTSDWVPYWLLYLPQITG